MSKQLKLRRGTTVQHASFTGGEGEITVDTTRDTAVVHDGSTVGGHPLLKDSDYRTSTTGSAKLPAGTTAERDGSPVTGYMRFNSTLSKFEGYNGSAWSSVGATDGQDVNFTQSGTGAVERTVTSKLRDVVSVLDYGADPTGVADSTAAINSAIATGRRVSIPKGTYKCNVTINNKTIIEGDGSLATILKPFDDAVAVMTYTFTAQQNPIYCFWDYHSEVRDIGFVSNSAMTGVGFTFGKTNPADYQTNDEYANNVKFYGCYFRGFDKGLQFPFGNIGTEIYSCGFNGNKYGVYTLDNKFGGLMHAGCKYFFGGEFSGNTVAIYINNAADGFGGITLTGTIIEGNQIGIYAFISPRVKDPIILDSVWFENNGATRAYPGTSVIDAWSGSTRSNQTVTDKTVIIDGAQSKINFHSMFVCDIHIKATNAEVVATGCRVEASHGFGGASFLVDYPETSYIRLENPYTDGGWAASGTYMPYVTGIGNNPATMLSAAAQNRCFQTNARGSKVTNYGPSRAMSSPLTSVATTGSGSFNLTGTVVSDGRIYASCNEFTRAAFSSSQYTRLTSPDSAIITSAGWYVFTLDAKVVSGAGVRIHVWNRGTAQLVASVQVNKIGYWQTFAAVGYSAGSQTLYLDFSGNNGDVTWRVSAYQIHRFDTQQEAFMFLQSNVFAES